MASKTKSAAVALVRRRGKVASKGMSAIERSERARNAALCRWNSHNALKGIDPQNSLFTRLLKVYSGRPMD